MKLSCYAHKGEICIGVIDDADETVRRLMIGPVGGEGVLALFERGFTPETAPLCDQATPLGEVSLLAPIPAPYRDLFCIGKNYRLHAQEFAAGGYDASAPATQIVPEHPVVFGKSASCVVGPGADVFCPPETSQQIDYEVELAVVIGVGGRNIPAGTALDHVLGYTLVNDLTARDWQKRHVQWLLGKSFDGFCPMGPSLVTRESLDPGTMRLRTWVNNELLQDGLSADLVFDVPSLVSVISRATTLRRGDIIATGTPAGVGIGFDPPRFLRHGDEVVNEIEGIGRLGFRFLTRRGGATS